MKNKFHKIFAVVAIVCGFAACVDNDDDVVENYYSASKLTAAQFLEQKQETLSEFLTLLKRTPYFSLLSTYGTFTVFAPNNDAMDEFLREAGYSSVESMSDEACDSLARTYIVKNGAYFTTDIGEGALPELNMADAYITLSLDSDVTNNNALVYYVNKTSRMVEYDDSVTNGVVHIVGGMMKFSSEMLPDQIAADSTLTLFYEALELTGMRDSLLKYEDENYVWATEKGKQDSVHTGVMVRCTSGSELFTRSFWPEKRYFKYTAFVEPDSVFHRYGIYTIDDLKAYAKSVYDATYPKDAGLYDDNPKHRRNPLNRFVSYHLLNRIGQYNQWCGSRELRESCWYTNLVDAEDYFETMCPFTIIRICDNSQGLFINRRGVDKRADIRGVKVLSPSESGNSIQNATNGVYHYIDDILTYSVDVRDKVLNRRIRIDATTLSPDFMNCNGRGRYGEDILTGFRNESITDWKVDGARAYVGVHSDVGYWNSYEANAVCVSGIFDVTFKLPPVPAGTYEIRLGYTVGWERGVVQFYLKSDDGQNVSTSPCGLPVDLRRYLTETEWIPDDANDPEKNTANDKALHNLGYMKGLGAYRSGGAENPLRNNNWNLRRILTTETLKEETSYYLRCRQVLDDPSCYWSFDFIEICPKSVYASPEGEDIY